MTPERSPVTANIEPSNPIAPAAGPILFYDGTCGFCSGIVQFILKHERGRRSLRFAPLQGPTAESLRAMHPELSKIDSVVWHQPATAGERERVWVRSTAGLAAIAYLGGMWRVLAALAWCVPRPIRDAVYNTVARNRRRLSRHAACSVPLPEQRIRFID